MVNARFLLTRYAWLSIATALCTIALKTGAFYLTGSVGLLSDAVESLVNLAGAILALAMLIVAARPADEKHPFGHSKAEYFASGFEGLLIILAACGIVYTAAGRFFHPEPLTKVGLGLIVSLGASAANLFTARVLIQAGKKYDSITLEADGKQPRQRGVLQLAEQHACLALARALAPVIARQAVEVQRDVLIAGDQRARHLRLEDQELGN